MKRTDEEMIMLNCIIHKLELLFEGGLNHDAESMQLTHILLDILEEHYNAETNDLISAINKGNAKKITLSLEGLTGYLSRFSIDMQHVNEEQMLTEMIQGHVSAYHALPKQKKANQRQH